MSSTRRASVVSRGSVVGTFIVVLVALTCVRLGIWQLHRLEQKRTRNAAVRARGAEAPLTLAATSNDTTGLIFRRIEVSGRFDEAHTVIIAGRALEGSPGVHVLTPLRMGNSAVLINRGWLGSADAAQVQVPPLHEDSVVRVTGLVMELPNNPRATDRVTPGEFRKVWYHPSVSALQTNFPYPMLPYVVQLLPAPGARDEPRRLPLPQLDEGPHLGYAIQWFGFAITAIVGWIILLTRRANSKAGDD